jgi:hypothetical protein
MPISENSGTFWRKELYEAASRIKSYDSMRSTVPVFRATFDNKT